VKDKKEEGRDYSKQGENEVVPVVVDGKGDSEGFCRLSEVFKSREKSVGILGFRITAGLFFTACRSRAWSGGHASKAQGGEKETPGALGDKEREIPPQRRGKKKRERQV